MSDEETKGQGRYGVYRARVTDNKGPRGARPRQRAPRERAASLGRASDPPGRRPLWHLVSHRSETTRCSSRSRAATRAGPRPRGALWGKGDPPPESGEDAPTAKTIRTRCGATITIDDARCQVKVEAPGVIRLVTSGRLEAASTQVELDAGLLRVNAPSAEFSGIVRCDTLITNSVVASSYTPGSGNVM
jgi:hypothetical protein